MMRIVKQNYEGDRYEHIAPSIEAYLKELIAPVEILQFSYGMYRYFFITDAKLDDLDAIASKVEKKFDTYFELHEMPGLKPTYILDTAICP